MNAVVFAIVAVAFALIPIVLAARRHIVFAVPALILFSPYTASVLVLHRQTVAWLADSPEMLMAMQAGYLTLHACFVAFVLFHFIAHHRITSWELLYVVPGQAFFVGAIFYGFFYALGSPFEGNVFATSTAAIVVFGLTGVAMATTHVTRTVRERIPVPALRTPLRIAHLSDIHVGTFMGDGRLQRMAREINRQRPDMVVATGDFLTTRSERDYSPLIRFFQALERPPYGVFACLGNHDLPVGRRLTHDLEDAGVRMLVNDGEDVPLANGERLRVAGLHFYWRDRAKEYPAAFSKAVGRTAGAVLLLCHDPAAWDYLEHDWDGLMLAGHLHGGQFGLNWIGLPVSILRLFGMYDQGVFRRGRAALYVHRGTGVYGFPVRFGVPAEIAILELTAAPALDPFASAPERR